MSNKLAIIGLQMGDCGKGRVSAYFGKKYDWSVRFNGGNNAGHTVYDSLGNVHKLHHLPAGIVHGKKIALDSGMVIDLDELAGEIQTFGNPIDLYISENVHTIQHSHKEKDANGSSIGSTKRGIAYVYSDRALRNGIRIGDIGEKKISQRIGCQCNIYRGLPPISTDESALFEGAQGIMLDVDYGCYPYVTSSSVMPSMAHRIDKIIGVMKAYVSRVGDGPPNHPDIEELRNLGQEFGTTTGRPRKCTWFDVDQINYAISVVQPEEIVVTKLDVLKDINIKIYKNNEEIVIGNLDNYKNFLVEQFPQVKWFSESPTGDLKMVI